jgi:hypothetical protein
MDNVYLAENIISQPLVAHTCNPCYSGGRDHEDGRQFEASPRQIVCETLSPKNPSQKRAGGMTQGVALSSNPMPPKKKKIKTKWKT